MIEAQNEDPWKAVGASAVDATAARWLARREHADWSSADQAELDTWLSASTAHMVTYLRLHDAWNRADRLAALRAPMRETPAVPDIQERGGQPALKIAAVCVLAAGVAAAMTHQSAPRDATYSTPVGGREVIALSDGSQVELNTNTTLRIRIGDRRTVTLDKGEAYFQIKHDAKHPFVVNAFGHRVTDLGTKFVVRGSGKRLEVTLVEGRARIDTTTPGLHEVSAVLTPGDVAIANANTVSVTKKPTGSMADQLAWREGMLVFDHATLAEVAAQFNRYNSRKIVIADPAIAHLSLMGKFPVNDVALFGRVAKAVLGVDVADRGNEVVVSKSAGK